MVKFYCLNFAPIICCGLKGLTTIIDVQFKYINKMFPGGWNPRRNLLLKEQDPNRSGVKNRMSMELHHIKNKYTFR